MTKVLFEYGSVYVGVDHNGVGRVCLGQGFENVSRTVLKKTLREIVLLAEDGLLKLSEWERENPRP